MAVSSHRYPAELRDSCFGLPIYKFQTPLSSPVFLSSFLFILRIHCLILSVVRKIRTQNNKIAAGDNIEVTRQ